MIYESYISQKLETVGPSGLIASPKDIGLFDFQESIARWALRRGRAAVFADTGLGKTRMELAWADTICRETGAPVLMLAPLAVAAQTVAQGAEVGIDVNHAREQSDIKPGINITNYDRLHLFDTSSLSGVVADESSIIKHENSKTLQMMMDKFSRTPYKLCATATPSPNDFTELGTHAEFLGICTRTEMLSEFFVHDGGDTASWRLKGHARDEFWKWVTSWGVMVRSPADIGFDATRYILPPLRMHEHLIESSMEEAQSQGLLFPVQASTLMERKAARKGSMSARVECCADLVNKTDGHFLVWCDLNDEGNMLNDAIPGSVNVQGSDDTETKEKNLLAFANGDFRVLITKPKIAGFGLNFQQCHQQAFVGVNDSFESFYQSVRRSWRFGQKNPVDIHLFVSETEGSVLANLKRKEAAAKVMADEMSIYTRDSVMSELRGLTRQTNAYSPSMGIELPSWL